MCLKESFKKVKLFSVSFLLAVEPTYKKPRSKKIYFFKTPTGEMPGTLCFGQLINYWKLIGWILYVECCSSGLFFNCFTYLHAVFFSFRQSLFIFIHVFHVRLIVRWGMQRFQRKTNRHNRWSSESDRINIQYIHQTSLCNQCFYLSHLTLSVTLFLAFITLS